jgi:peptidoglycan/LPS O-acetylase OafA/YrhL
MPPVLSYLPELDGLRAVSILLVVVSHLGLDHLVPGAFGVTLFFFLSGFLITRQLLHTLRTAGRLDFAGFYARRALRLMPACVVFILLAGGAFCLAGGRVGLAGWLAALFYGANYYDLVTGYRSTLAGVRHPFNILWSLAIEEHFYAVWPLLLAAAWRWRRVALAVLGVCTAVLVWRAFLFHACYGPGVIAWRHACLPQNPSPLWRYNRLYMATDTRFDSIAWGALLALGDKRLGGKAAWLGAALLAASFLLPGPFARWVLRPSLQGAALYCLVPSLLHGAGVTRQLLAAPVAVFIGRLSYSLYLWHWAALAVADRLAGGNTLRWLGIAVPLAAGLAMASYFGIERPMLTLRRRFGSHAPLTLGEITGAAPAGGLQADERPAPLAA